jgi:hypothetical protein
MMSTSIDVYGGGGEVELAGGEVVDFRGSPGALESLTRAEIDVQVATANRYPRSIERFVREARAMVSYSQDLAERCTFTLPYVDPKTKKKVTGPSVRLAEILVPCWRHIRMSGRIIEEAHGHVTAQALAMDCERNIGYQIEVRRGILTREGHRFTEDGINKTCNAAVAIATRNATFKVIPMAFVTMIWDEAKRVAKGDIKTLPERTARALEYFASLGVREADVFRVLGIAGAGDVTLDDLMELQGFRTAIQSGEATVAEVFHPAEPPAPAPAAVPGESRSEGLSRKLGGGGNGKDREKEKGRDEAPKPGREPGEDG